MTCPPVKTVGLIFSKKKKQRSAFSGLEEYARYSNILCQPRSLPIQTHSANITILSQHGIQIVHVDLDHAISLQGNFDLIVHKLTDLIAAATKGQEDAERQLANFEQYTKVHPQTLILDPLPDVNKLMDRRGTFAILKTCLAVHARTNPHPTEPLFYLPNHICLPNIHTPFSKDLLAFPVSVSNVKKLQLRKVIELNRVYNVKDTM